MSCSTWYEIDWRGDIKPLDVVKETAKQIVYQHTFTPFNGNPYTNIARKSKDGIYRTEAEAIAARRERLENDIKAYLRLAEQSEKALSDFNAKYPPEANP